MNKYVRDFTCDCCDGFFTDQEPEERFVKFRYIKEALICDMCYANEFYNLKESIDFKPELIRGYGKDCRPKIKITIENGHYAYTDEVVKQSMKKAFEQDDKEILIEVIKHLAKR